MTTITITILPRQVLQLQQQTQPTCDRCYPTCSECYYCPTCSKEEFNSLIGRQVDISDDTRCKAFIDRRLNPFRQMYLNICYPGREQYLKDNI